MYNPSARALEIERRIPYFMNNVFNTKHTYFSAVFYLHVPDNGNCGALASAILQLY